MIEKIRNALEELGEKVQTGICKKDQDGTWDCLLIRKKRMEKNGTSRTDYSYYISIRIIKENEIPEGLEFDVINKMKEIGYRHAQEPVQYDYTIDSNEVVVEICELLFVKPRKA